MIKFKKNLIFATKLAILVSFFFWIINDISLKDWKFPCLKNSSYLILAVLTALFIPHLFWVSLIWKNILKELNQKISSMEAWKICSISSLGRYIPGKIWLFVGKASYAKGLGLGMNEVGISMIFEIVGNLLGAGVITIACVFFSENLFERISGNFSLLFASALTGAVLTHPKILIPLVNWVLFFLKRNPIVSSSSAKGHYFLIVSYTLDWFYQGLLFCFLVVQIESNISVLQFPTLLFIFTFSWVVGFLSFLTPGGIGVREGMMLVLLQKMGFQGDAAISIAIFSRIWMTIPELVMGSWFWLSNPYKPKIKKYRNG